MAQGARNRIRVIGGQWRGRRLDFVPVAGLRPTPDRVRETLFNWLAPVIQGARCLDLFAGTGILGIEAVSRGAAGADLVEHNERACAQLRKSLALLDHDSLRLHCQDALQFLRDKAPAAGYDLVFLDPPYDRHLLLPCCQALADGNWLRPGAQLYMEDPRALSEEQLPTGMHIRKCKQAGQVHYHLVTWG